jgi:hypothetical protein
MRSRRQEVQRLLQPDEAIVSMSTFPRLGCNVFTRPEAGPDRENSFSRSLFWPSEATYLGHPRFKTLTRNIRERREEKVHYYNLLLSQVVRKEVSPISLGKSVRTYPYKLTVSTPGRDQRARVHG